MPADAEDLTIHYEEEGQVIVRELDKAILSKGAWTTIIFRYQEWDRRKNEFGPDKYTIRRFRKIRGQYLPQSKFNISSRAQAEKICAVLQGWL